MGRYADDVREWLEADGLGGFASGTVSGIRTRRYQALLLAATTPPTGRMVLVNGFDAWVETAAGRFALSSQRYAPGVLHPDGSSRIVSFACEPWPTWEYELEDGTRVRQEIFVPHERAAAVVSWRLLSAKPTAARLTVRPFLSGRDYHSMHHENGSVRSEVTTGDGVTVFRPYDGVPAITSRANARYEHRPDWYRNFHYTAEQERGLDDREDLFSPGELTWDLEAGEGFWIVEAGDAPAAPGDARSEGERLRAAERSRRAAFATPLHRAADAYLVRRDAGRTIVAGYPWFTDWGRDAFIAIRGLCLSTGFFADARDILLEWSGVVSEGMLPNRFPDGGSEPEFNAVDASLWFVAAVQAFCAEADAGRVALAAADRARMLGAVTAILDGYARGTRFGIRADADGLLACGVPGVQLTWMDSKIGDWVVTPRTGKPVEVQALWINALGFAAGELRRSGGDGERWADLERRARAAFAARFWNPEARCLYDVVDVDHQAGRVDGTVRPNQILAVGGLGLCLLDDERARAVVDAVEQRLLTPVGLRSLAPGQPGYVRRYEGGPAQRDSSYHQGTVWPWLIGPFVDAWLRVRGEEPGAVQMARDRFVAPLLAHLEEAGLGHVSEITDADPPFTPRGCPFQAWSLGELLRAQAGLAQREAGMQGRSAVYGLQSAVP